MITPTTGAVLLFIILSHQPPLTLATAEERKLRWQQLLPWDEVLVCARNWHERCSWTNCYCSWLLGFRVQLWSAFKKDTLILASWHRRISMVNGTGFPGRGEWKRKVYSDQWKKSLTRIWFTIYSLDMCILSVKKAVILSKCRRCCRLVCEGVLFLKAGAAYQASCRASFDCFFWITRNLLELLCWAALLLL